ncbi:MAG: D-alanyl-D-alanine carboxypeptidase family protein [Peptococcales bacterium]
MRKLLVLFLVLLFFTISTNIELWAAPNIEGKAFVLIDGKTGQVLYGKEIDEKLYPASTTKILTTIIALEKGNLQDMVTISKNVPLVEGTKVYLRAGEKIELEKLLNAAMIHSANDAALAIAEHIGGSEEKFAQMMNEKAKELGVKNSNFVNPHGLTAENHYSTAYDLALISRYAMENPKFRELAQEKVYDWAGEEWQTRLININKFLWRMEESTGIKSGYTSAARYTLAASAQKNTQELIAVILGSSDARIWDDAKALLEYGFANFQNLSLATDDEVVATLKVANDQEVNLIPARSATIAVNNNEETNVERRLVLGDLSLPIEAEKVVGELIISLNGEEKERIPVKSQGEVKKPIDWVRVAINTLAGLFILQIFVRIIRRYLKRRRRTRIFGSSRRITNYRY